ncbi:MAG: threonylcarbamoyl-AMP synthase [Candidatus Hydrogenedentes bacterium]|nr:threonylcarbamoyl-AMP synthase [Candidatus Hydrogenedentota bacterium]
MERIEANPTSIARAVEALRAGEVIAYPTETVYGLGANPFDAGAMERLFEAKGRDRSNPILLIVASRAQLDRVVSGVSPQALACMDAFWPGPLSVLFPRHPSLPDLITAGSDKVCVRCPGHDWARTLCEAFGGPVTSTSANRSGSPVVQSLDELDLPGVDLGFDGGTLDSSQASTILDAESGTILREGAIAREEIARILG